MMMLKRVCYCALIVVSLWAVGCQPEPHYPGKSPAKHVRCGHDEPASPQEIEPERVVRGQLDTPVREGAEA